MNIYNLATILSSREELAELLQAMAEETEYCRMALETMRKGVSDIISKSDGTIPEEIKIKLEAALSNTNQEREEG